MSTQAVATERRGQAGWITIDRGRALNALDRAMIAALDAAVIAFADDSSMSCIVVASGDARAFCAGGDIREMRDRALSGDHPAIRDYFAAEYALNLRIARCPKPYVALIDGICMGGGLGISMHGQVRVVTEASRLAMPETIIGFFPDVGASHVLPRLTLPGVDGGALGRYLGLAGPSLDGADAVACGLATHFCPRERLPALSEALARDGVAGLKSVAPPASALAQSAGAIARGFAADRPDAILEALDAAADPWSAEVAAALRSRSPSALLTTALLLTRGATLSLEAALGLELELACDVARTHDFTEGVRAALVDKDRQPRWNPARLDAAAREAVLARFEAAARRAAPVALTGDR